MGHHDGADPGKCVGMHRYHAVQDFRGFLEEHAAKYPGIPGHPHPIVQAKVWSQRALVLKLS